MPADREHRDAGLVRASPKPAELLPLCKKRDNDGALAVACIDDDESKLIARALDHLCEFTIDAFFLQRSKAELPFRV